MREKKSSTELSNSRKCWDVAKMAQIKKGEKRGSSKAFRKILGRGNNASRDEEIVTDQGRARPRKDRYNVCQ